MPVQGTTTSDRIALPRDLVNEAFARQRDVPRAIPAEGMPGVAPMHILVTVNASWNLLNFRKSLLEALLADGHRITALAPRDESSVALEEMGCRFIPLDMDSKGLSPMRDLVLLTRFWRVFRQERPDAILGYTVKNNVYGALAARAAGIPFLPNVSGLGTAFLAQSWLQTLVKGLYRAAFAKVPVAFFQNQDDRALFVDAKLVERVRTQVLPGSGIDLDHFRPAPMPQGTGVRFLLIARMLKDKGVGEFVDAARIVKRTHPAAEFQLLGAAGAENRTAIDREVIDGWVREGVVEYLGTVEDVRPSIAAADCVVLPSYREGAPRTLIEAAAMARPVIATRVPGCTAVVEDGVTGLLCNVRDAEDLARKMRAFVDAEPAERARMGVEGRGKMEREYDQELVIAAYKGRLAAHAAAGDPA